MRKRKKLDSKRERKKFYNKKTAPFHQVLLIWVNRFWSINVLLPLTMKSSTSTKGNFWHESDDEDLSYFRLLSSTENLIAEKIFIWTIRQTIKVQFRSDVIYFFLSPPHEEVSAAARLIYVMRLCGIKKPAAAKSFLFGENVGPCCRWGYTSLQALRASEVLGNLQNLRSHPKPLDISGKKTIPRGKFLRRNFSSKTIHPNDGFNFSHAQLRVSTITLPSWLHGFFHLLCFGRNLHSTRKMRTKRANIETESEEQMFEQLLLGNPGQKLFEIN